MRQLCGDLAENEHGARSKEVFCCDERGAAGQGMFGLAVICFGHPFLLAARSAVAISETLEDSSEPFAARRPRQDGVTLAFMAEVSEKAQTPVTKAIELMRADLARRWTVAALARAVAVSRPVLARRFVQETGLSPLRYLTKLRMDRAAALLVGSSATLAEVSLLVGYDSEFAFSRAFRRRYRRPPGLFRREERARTFRTPAVSQTFCIAA